MYMQAEDLASVKQELAIALKLAEGAKAAEEAATAAAAKAEQDAAATLSSQEHRSALVCCITQHMLLGPSLVAC